jgi:toxin CptA
VSSPSDRFECRWQASRLLLTAYLGAQALVLLSLYCLDISPWAAALGALLCLTHAALVLPRAIALNHGTAYTGLRHGIDGWQIWSKRDGWQDLHVCNDSVVLPLIVVLRFRLVCNGRLQRRVRSACIPFDAVAPDIHRRLRVRLKFSRRGSAEPG